MNRWERIQRICWSCYDKDHEPLAIGVSREREISKCFNLFETPRLLIVRSVDSTCPTRTSYHPSPSTFSFYFPLSFSSRPLSPSNYVAPSPSPILLPTTLSVFSFFFATSVRFIYLFSFFSFFYSFIYYSPRIISFAFIIKLEKQVLIPFFARRFFFPFPSPNFYYYYYYAMINTLFLEKKLFPILDSSKINEQ